ncbi:hypothetical protein [Spiroplasma endosymbiont of Amphibalanus improvisus]|uniref:hypothetical protein n=1 Tax=Spiroplasma endosymbiont of Amphibalanus improvisus TaxID=3066327 RepID=UPI00313CB894
MKKLISLLSTMTLAAAPVIGVVGCSSDDKYDDQIWAWLPGLDDGEDITSADVWRNVTPFSDDNLDLTDPMSWNADIRAVYLHHIMLIFNVSLLATAKDYDDNSDDDSNAWNKMFKAAVPGNKNYINVISRLQKEFSKDWDKLIETVDREVNDKKEEYKSDYGNKWNKEWDSFLEDYDGSEENYKADLMLEGDSINATTLVNNELKKYSDVGYDIPVPVANIQSGYLDAVTDENGDIDNSEFTREYSPDAKPGDTKYWSPEELELLREIVLSATPYDPSDDSSVEYQLWEKDRNGKAEWKDYRDAFKALISGNDYDLSGDMMFDVPPAKLIGSNYVRTDLDSDKSVPTEGVISTAQVFELNKWYNNFHPVAYSSASFPFKDGESISNGISTSSFSQSDQDNIKKVLDGNGTENFFVKSPDFLTLNSITDPDPDPDESTNNNLGTGTPASIDIDALNAVYNLLCDTNNEIPTVSTYSDLITQVSRNVQNDADANGVGYDYTTQHMFARCIPSSNSQTVAYIDESGLNFITVKGTNYNGSTSWTTPNDTFDEKVANDDFIQTTSKIPNGDVWSQNEIDDVVNNCNQGIENNYLRYLFNYSYARDYSCFNSPIDSANDYSNFDTSTDVNDNSEWWMFTYDYIGELEKATTANANWFSDFIEINDTDEVNNPNETAVINLIQNDSYDMDQYYLQQFYQKIATADDDLKNKGDSYPVEQYRRPDFSNYIFKG